MSGEGRKAKGESHASSDDGDGVERPLAEVAVAREGGRAAASRGTRSLV